MNFDLAEHSTRELNRTLQSLAHDTNENHWQIANPKGMHALACGLSAPLRVEILGHAGFYCAGMNQNAEVVIHGHTGPGVAENMMSGVVRVKGNASQSAGATANGGLLVIEGDASSRCGISLKGAEIVVGGNVGHMSAFMAQSGTLAVCGDAGEALGDSLYEAKLFVRGSVRTLGADCIEKEMKPHHQTHLAALLERAEIKADAATFRRYGSARTLYNFKIDNADPALRTS